MKQTIHIYLIVMILATSFYGKSQAIVEDSVFVVENTIPDYIFKDQFGNSHTINDTIENLILAFEQKPAHAVNDFLAEKHATFLQDHKSLFIADVSVAPKIIQKTFILPGLKKFEYKVLIFTNKKEAEPFREGVDVGKILKVTLENRKISSITEFEPMVEALESIL